VANTVYWTVRREIGNKDSEKVLKKLLGYSIAHSQQPLPDDQEEPEDIIFHDQWDEETANQYVAKLNSTLTKLYQNVLSLAKRFKDAGMKISPSFFQSCPTKSTDFLTNMVGMDFNLFCFVETVKTFEAKSETDRYGSESTGFHSNDKEAREYLKRVVRGFYKREYQDQLKLKESRVKAAKLQDFLLSFRTMPFKEFVSQLQENVPNQTSIKELLELVADDVKKMVDPVSKVELLLTGRYEESTWNNGSVARASSGLLLKLLEQIVPAERFAIVREHVRRFSWHRCFCLTCLPPFYHFLSQVQRCRHSWKRSNVEPTGSRKLEAKLLGCYGTL
jgi:hypothetical protein